MAKVKMFSTALCPFCFRAKQLLKHKGADVEEIDVTFSPSKRAEMAEAAGSRTVPQIWIGERHVGGCDELYALDAKGELEPLLRGDAA